MSTVPSPDNEPTQPSPPFENVLGPSALKALAHPLRVRILDTLSTHGPLTASGLGSLLDESSGSTSYHLRQLAKHGLVREVEGKGTARERWWERTPGGFTISSLENRDDAAALAASRYLNIEFERARQAKIVAFLGASETAEPWLVEQWFRSSVLSTSSFWATPEQMERVVAAWESFFEEHLAHLRGQEDTPGARAVQIHFNAFPVVDVPGNESADDDEG